MPDDNKIVIELEVQVKQLKKDLSVAQRELKGFSKTTAKSADKSLKVLEEMRDLLKEMAKAYKETGTAANRAGRAQSEAARSATREQKKLNAELQRTAELSGGGGGPGGGGGGAGAGGPSRGRRAYEFFRHPFGGGPNQRGMGRIGRASFGLMGKGAGFLLGGMQQAYGTYMQYGMARYGMTGLGTPGGMRRGMRAAGRGRTGVSLGFTPTETAQMAPGVAGATGALGATGVAQQLALAGGFGPGRAGEAIQYMGTMRQAGAEFGGAGNIKARQKDFSKTIALGMQSGLEKARLPEFFAGVGQLVRAQFSTAAGKVDSNAIAKQLAVLGAGGAGFQGARGAQIMGQLDAMIKRPGGGEAGQAVVLQAMGFGKPGGKVNYYDALKKQQAGIRDPQNIKRVMEEVYRQRGVVEAGGADPRNREANMQFATLSGLSLEQVEKLKDIHASNMTSTEKQKEIEKVMKDAEPIDKQALRVSKEGFAGIKKHFAGVEAMQIKIGARFAKPMMQLQQFQLQMLDSMTKYLPTIIDWLKKIFNAILQAIAYFTPGDTKKNLEKISKNFDKQQNIIEKQQIKSVQQLQKQQDDIVNIRDQYHLQRQQAVLKGSGGFMGTLQYAFGDTKKNVRQARRNWQTDPTIAAAERRGTMASQFQVATSDLPGWVQRDPSVIKALKRAAYAADKGDIRRQLYNKAIETAKRRAQEGQRVLGHSVPKKAIYGDVGEMVPKVKVVEKRSGDARRLKTANPGATDPNP